MVGSTYPRRPSKKGAEGEPGPAIILIEPQLGENIGMAARAMLNAGLSDLRLVKPRDGWPNEAAVKASAGAHAVVDGARIFSSTADAVSDLNYVLATTARPRDMVKETVTPKEGAAELRAHVVSGSNTGVLFGRESKGMSNDDIALADKILMVPLSPAFASLNLAQAVLLLSYEWYQAGLGEVSGDLFIHKDTRPATKKELTGLFGHLEDELDACGFLRVSAKRPSMVRNLRNLLQRAQLTEQEVRTLHGVVTCLVDYSCAEEEKD